MTKQVASIGLSALILGLLLGIVANGANTLGIDKSVTELIQNLDGRGWHWLADFGNLLGYSIFALSVLAVGCVLLAIRRDWWNIAFLLSATILRSLGSLGKERFDSPRPNANFAEIVGNFDGYGYPSGHVMTATTMLGALALVVNRDLNAWREVNELDGSRSRADMESAPTEGSEIRAHRYKMLPFWVAGLGVTSTAFARIWFGAHWLSDTIGGALFGITIVAIAWTLTNEIRRRSPGQSPAQ